MTRSKNTQKPKISGFFFFDKNTQQQQKYADTYHSMVAWARDNGKTVENFLGCLLLYIFDIKSRAAQKKQGEELF